MTDYEGIPFFEGAVLSLLGVGLVPPAFLAAFMCASQQTPSLSSHSVYFRSEDGRGGSWVYLDKTTYRDHVSGRSNCDLAELESARVCVNALPDMGKLVMPDAVAYFLGLVGLTGYDSEVWHPDYTWNLLRAYMIAEPDHCWKSGIDLNRAMLHALGPHRAGALISIPELFNQHVLRHGNLDALAPLMLDGSWRAVIEKAYSKPFQNCLLAILRSLGTIARDDEAGLFRVYLEQLKGTIAYSHLSSAIERSKGPFLASLLREIAARGQTSTLVGQLFSRLATAEEDWYTGDLYTRVDMRRNIRSALSMFDSAALTVRFNDLITWRGPPSQVPIELYEMLVEMHGTLLIDAYFSPEEVRWAVKSFRMRDEYAFGEKAIRSIRSGYFKKLTEATERGADLPWAREYSAWISFYGDRPRAPTP